MVYEDFTTYTETDSDGDITINSSVKITVDTMLNTAISHVVKSYGADHFTDLEHLIDVKYVSAPEALAAVACWALCNNAAYTIQDMIDNTHGICFYLYRSSAGGVPFRVYIRDWNLGNLDFFDLGFNPPYQRYLTITRTDTSLVCKIYTDSDRTNLEDTLSIVCVNTAFEYLYVVSSREHASAVWTSCIVENLDIGEVEEGGSLQPIKHWGAL